jgi:hypothetical protein
MKKFLRRELSLVVVLAAVALLSAGCAGGSKSSVTNPGAPGQLSANPSSIAFGSVPLNTSTAQSVQLTNPGSSSITISGASTSGPGFQMAGLPSGTTLAPGQNATFSVMFNPSSPGAASGSVQITPGGASPVTISLTGTGISGPAPHTVSLSWNPSPSAVVGYNVYRGNQSGGPYTQIDASVVATTVFSDSSVAAGKNYWYVVTSVAAGGAESAHSNEIKVTIPTP